MIFTQFRNSRLLRAIIFGFQNFFIPPFIAGCRTEHAAHQVIMTIRMGKGMQRIVFIHTKMLTGNENCSGSPQRNIAFAFSHCTCSHCRCCIIAGTGNNFYIFRKAQFLCDFLFQCTHHFIALIKLWQHFSCNTADIKHFLRPAAMLHIHQKHTGCIGHICTESTG